MWWAAAAGVALALGLAALVTYRGGWDLSAFREVDTEHQTYDRPITTLVFDQFRSGDVVVEAGPASGVAVERVLKWNGAKPSVSEDWSGETLTVRHDCGVVAHSCSIRYTVKVPASVAVRVDATSGDVRISGITGDLRMRTTSGDVTVDRPAAAVNVTTTSGDVTLSDARSSTVALDTTSGDVESVFSVAPQSFSAHTTSGNITARLPRGDQYKVTVQTTSGDRHVLVDQSAEAARSITAQATSGDVSISYV